MIYVLSLAFALTAHAVGIPAASFGAPLAYLNHFGAAPTPADDDPRFLEATAFMARARPGGTLKLGHPESFFSIFPSSIRGGDFKPRAPNTDQFIYETLMTQDPRRQHSTVYPLVAREVRATADLCRVSVRLRDDVTFSDGARLRTADVARSLHATIHEYYSGAMEALIKRIYGTVVLTEKDDLNFELAFTELPATQCRQAAYYVLAYTPLIKPNPRPRVSEDVRMPYLGTGPYRVAFADRSRIQMTKPRVDVATDVPYWGTTHPLRRNAFNPDAVETRTYLDQTMERFALLRGDVNLMRDKTFTFDEWMIAHANGRHPFARLPQASDDLDEAVGAIWMNQRHVDTGNADFRRALILVWNLSRVNHDFYADRRHSGPTLGFESALAPRGPASPAVRRILETAAGHPIAGTGDDELGRALNSSEQLEYARLAAVRDHRARMRLALRYLNRAGYAYARIGGRTKLVKDGRPVVLTAIAKSESTETKLFLVLQRELNLLGIELKLRWYPDRESLVAALNGNAYDLYPGSVDVARNFSILNMNYLAHAFHSRSRDSLGAWGRVSSKILDGVVEYLETKSPGTPEYAAGADALLRAINANVPVILSGEIDPVVSYHARELRVWNNREMDVQTLYFERGTN